MKKVLLAISWPAYQPRPNLDVILAASLIVTAEQDARFLLVPVGDGLGGSEVLKKAAKLMLADPPPTLKLLTLGWTPREQEDIEWFLNLSQANIYILDTGQIPLDSILQAPHLSYRHCDSIAMAASNLYFTAGRQTSWRRLMALHLFLHGHGKDALDRLPQPDTSAFLEELDRTYGSWKIGEPLDRLFYLLQYVTEFVDNLRWTKSSTDLLEAAGHVLGPVLAFKEFLDRLIAGHDPELFSEAQIRRCKEIEEKWIRLIGVSPLISLPVGLHHAPRFLGAVLLDLHSDTGPNWLSPALAAALIRRAKAQCLVTSQRGRWVTLTVLRAHSGVDCLEAARALGVSPQGSPWMARLRCSDEEWSMRRRRLKVDRNMTQWKNIKPVPCREPPPPLQRRSTQRKISGNNNQQNAVAPPGSRLRSRNTMQSLNGESLTE